MDMYSLIILLCLLMIGLQFWRLRGIAESTISFAQRYCQKEGLQYISLARVKTRMSVKRGKPDWHIIYQLEFSSDGETNYTGSITTHGRKVMKVELPVYRLAPDAN
ncbi:DUF3301 domain-containing protein [Ningiella sp. W23]|uniref:DUF3301 domain-containing protein n=1 Tax=Ningiella sp. W23 TaxID=3023715 RepID=UPI003756A98B